MALGYKARRLLVFVGLMVGLSEAWPQTTDVRLVVYGDLDATIGPGEVQKIVVEAQTTGSGVVELGVRGVLPPFVQGWDNKRVAVSGQQVVRDTLWVEPGRETACGEYSFMISATLGEDAKDFQSVKLRVVPTIVPEPPYSPDGFNEICWTECSGAHDHDLVIREKTDQSPSLPSEQMRGGDKHAQVCETIGNLANGVTYEYWIQTTLSDGTGIRVLSSDTVSSTQDATPPPPVDFLGFDVNPQNHVTLKWATRPDAIGFIQEFLVRRVRRGSASTPTDASFKVPFFPVSSISPANYLPGTAEVGASLYVDAPGMIIEKLPSILTGSTVISSALRDQWNPQDNFLSFELLTPARIYVAADNRQTRVPDWLSRDFHKMILDKVRANGEERLGLWESNEIFQPGQVSLGGNFGVGALMREFAKLMYVVFVKPVHSDLPFATPNEVTFVDDTLPAGQGGPEVYEYEIIAVDAVGNETSPVNSGPVVFDPENVCGPTITQWYDCKDELGRFFASGVANSICIEDPSKDPVCLNILAADSVQFQAVRDSMKFFSVHLPSQVDIDFFDSGWKSLKNLNPGLCHLFNLLPDGKDASFVDGHKYFYRVRFKDSHGNVSMWSDTSSAVQDAFPPGDARNLKAENQVVPDGTSGQVIVSWDPAVDTGSGVRDYIIHRLSGASVTMNTISGSQTSYQDPFSNLNASITYTYKVGSVDFCGHARGIEEVTPEVRIRPAIGPSINFESDSLIVVDGVNYVKHNSVSLCWREYDQTAVSRFEIETGFDDSLDAEPLVVEADEACVPVDLGADGVYTFRVRAIFDDGQKTTWSKVDSVIKSTKPPAIPTNVLVTNDPAEFDSEGKHGFQPFDGNLYLTWNPSPGVAYYEIWRDGARLDTVSVPRYVDFYDDPDDERLVAFKRYHYRVMAVNVLGMQSQPSEPFQGKNYCNRAPSITRIESVPDSGEIRLEWAPPEPSFVGLDSIQYRVLISQDGVDFESRLVAIKTGDAVELPCTHDYCFRVQAVEQRTGLVSAPSDTACRFLHCVAHIPAADRVDLQTQPVNSGIFVSSETYWQNPVWADIPRSQENLFPRSDVDHFSVQRFVGSRLDTTFVLAYGTEDFNRAAFMDTFSLVLDSSYHYVVTPCESEDDSRCAGSGSSEAVIYDDWRVFIPGIYMAPFSKSKYFSGDTVPVHWQWFDRSGNTAEASELMGADSVLVQMSNNRDFVQDPVRGLFVEQQEKALDPEHPESPENRRVTFESLGSRVNVNHGDTLFMRIKASDRWGHSPDYPWSTRFDGVAVAVRDDRAPLPLTEGLQVRTVASAGSSPDSVDVQLSWPRPIDTVSGLDRYFAYLDSLAHGTYQTIRIDTFSVPMQEAERDTHTFEFLRAGVPDGTYRFRLEYEDCLNNRQSGNSPELYELHPAPENLTVVNSLCTSGDSTTTVSWSAVPRAIRYELEFADARELLGEPGTNKRTLTDTTISFHNQRDLGGTDITWYFHVKAIYPGNQESAWSNVGSNACDNPTDVVAQAPIPSQFRLSQNYPNPFNPSTTVSYETPYQTHVVITVYDILGHPVRGLVDAPVPGGRHTVRWDARDDRGQRVSTGVYLIEMVAADFKAVRKALLLK